MKITTSLALLGLSSAVSATFGLPHCWRKCARQNGLMCSWGDIPCLCKSVNAKLFANTNSCACSSCDDDDDNEANFRDLAFACRIARVAFVDPSVNARTSCKAEYTDSWPRPAAPLPPPPPPPMFIGVSPPPSAAREDWSAEARPTVAPTSSVWQQSVVAPPVLATYAEPSETNSYSYATLTVPVIPMPQQSGAAKAATNSTSSAAGASKANASSTSTAKTKVMLASSTGSAVRKEVGTVGWALSMLAVATVFVFGAA